MNENIIELYSHCFLCISELKALGYHTSPQDYADISVGLAADQKRIQLWCNRHNENIHIFNLAEPIGACCDDCELEDLSGI